MSIDASELLGFRRSLNFVAMESLSVRSGIAYLQVNPHEATILHELFGCAGHGARAGQHAGDIGGQPARLREEGRRLPWLLDGPSRCYRGHCKRRG